MSLPTPINNKNSMTDKDIYSAPEADLSNPDAVNVDNTPSRWLRLGGALIDGALMLLITVPIMFLGGLWEAAATNSSGLGFTLVMMVISIVAFLAIHGYTLINDGQTIGKKILGMKIVSIETGKIPPVLNLIGLRYLVFYVIGSIPLVIFSIIPLLGTLFIFQKNKRCLHDILAGTHVIKAEQ